MLTAIDIGNTNITFGIFAVEGARAQKGPLYMWRMSTDTRRTADEYGTQMLDFLHYALLNKEDVKAVAISSVVPAINATILNAAVRHLKKTPKVFEVGDFAAANLGVSVDNPSEVGVDRLMNALALREFFGAPSVAVDFGTAVTFDCVGRKGDYVGGVILPGPAAAANLLAASTAKLPKVVLKRLSRVVGKNTVECIQSGIYRGYTAMIKKFIKDIRNEIGKDAKVAATGGDAAIFKEDIKELGVWIPELTLEGVRLLWNKTLK
ncbi:MAG: type III pantothenate kinase [Endomicrobiia bacterium]|nr:type III pantothenate kinase [Endomicrobiia bacterium]